MRLKSLKIAGSEAQGRDQHQPLGRQRRNVLDRTDDGIGGDSAAEGMADDRHERAEPFAGQPCGFDSTDQCESAALRLAVPRQVERDNLVTGVTIAFDQRAHIFGARTPAMDDEHRADGPPARLWPEFMRHDAPVFGLQPMMARLGHEAGGAVDGASLAVAEDLGVRRAAEQFERRAPGKAGSHMFGGSKHAPDDLQSK